MARSLVFGCQVKCIIAPRGLSYPGPRSSFSKLRRQPYTFRKHVVRSCSGSSHDQKAYKSRASLPVISGLPLRAANTAKTPSAVSRNQGSSHIVLINSSLGTSRTRLRTKAWFHLRESRRKFPHHERGKMVNRSMICFSDSMLRNVSTSSIFFPLFIIR